MYTYTSGYGVFNRKPYSFLRVKKGEKTIAYKEESVGFDEIRAMVPKFLEDEEYNTSIDTYNSLEELLKAGFEDKMERSIRANEMSDEDFDAWLQAKEEEKEEERKKSKFTLVKKPRGYTVSARVEDNFYDVEFAQKEYKRLCERAGIEVGDIDAFNSTYYPKMSFGRMTAEKR